MSEGREDPFYLRGPPRPSDTSPPTPQTFSNNKGKRLCHYPKTAKMILCGKLRRLNT